MLGAPHICTAKAGGPYVSDPDHGFLAYTSGTGVSSINVAGTSFGGDPVPDRMIAFYTFHYRSAGSATLAAGSSSIGGQPVTTYGPYNHDGSGWRAYVGFAKVPGGTSGDVVLWWNNPLDYVFAAWWWLQGYDDVPVSAQGYGNDTGTTKTRTFTFGKPGLLIGGIVGLDAFGVNLTSPAESPDFSALADSNRYKGISAIVGAGNTDLTITMSSAPSYAHGVAGMAFEEA